MVSYVPDNRFKSHENFASEINKILIVPGLLDIDIHRYNEEHTSEICRQFSLSNAKREAIGDGVVRICPQRIKMQYKTFLI